MRIPSQPSESSDPQRLNLALQLHISEYQALTYRGTSWLALESGIWALMGVIVSLIPTVWAKDIPHDIVEWGAFALIQILLFVWANMMYEHYSSIHYLETELRPLVADLVGPTVAFWQYETYIDNKRPKSQPFWYEAAPAFGVFLIHAAIISYNLPLWPWPKREFVEIGVNLILSFAYVWGSIRTVKVRRHLTEGIALIKR